MYCWLFLIKVVFASDQTYELMQCLEEIEGLEPSDDADDEADNVRLREVDCVLLCV